MNIDALPKFTPEANEFWTKLNTEDKKLLLSNVWCSKCSRAATIKNFTGVVKSGDLLLVGECAECHGDVARLIESK